MRLIANEILFQIDWKGTVKYISQTEDRFLNKINFSIENLASIEYGGYWNIAEGVFDIFFDNYRSLL